MVAESENADESTEQIEEVHVIGQSNITELINAGE